MFVIQQLIKTLNNTEAGRTKTNDSYLRMTKGVDVNQFFDNDKKKKYIFVLKRDLKNIEIRVELCHDGIRIYNMGKISNVEVGDLWGGDKIILEKRIYTNCTEYYIDYEKNTKAVFFQNFKNKGFELLTPEKKALIEKDCSVELKLLGKESKRKDSDEIEYYDIIFEGKKIPPNLEMTELLKLEPIEGSCRLSKTQSWEFYQYQIEE